MDALFRIQKKSLQILFGDREEFLNKFCTAARTRPFGEQYLSNSFYELEHSKPLFNENNIMNFKNQYIYMTLNELLLNISNPVLNNEIKLSNHRKVLKNTRKACKFSVCAQLEYAVYSISLIGTITHSLSSLTGPAEHCAGGSLPISFNS